jgi:hypothetical protein
MRRKWKTAEVQKMVELYKYVNLIIKGKRFTGMWNSENNFFWFQLTMLVNIIYVHFQQQIRNQGFQMDFKILDNIPLSANLSLWKEVSNEILRGFKIGSKDLFLMHYFALFPNFKRTLSQEKQKTCFNIETTIASNLWALSLNSENDIPIISI